jgi:hypothetical protein
MYKVFLAVAAGLLCVLACLKYLNILGLLRLDFYTRFITLDKTKKG